MRPTCHQDGDTVLALTNPEHPSLVSCRHVFLNQYNSRSPNQGTPILYYQTRASLYRNRNPCLISCLDYEVTIGHTQLASMAGHVV